jgi:hypothetical protein
VALWVDGNAGYLPLKKARRNTFIGNDLAVYVASPNDPVTFAAEGPFDWGTPADPGQNTLLCNAMVGNPTKDLGGDVWLFVPGPGVVPLSGNVWDHFPPTAAALAAKANGTDVTIELMPAPTLDTSGGRVSTTACPADRILGPASSGGGAR